MIAVRRLGHATLTTPDVIRKVAYYTTVVGLTLVERDGKRTFLASKQGLEAVALEPGPPNALSRLAFQVAPGSDLAELARELAKHGIKSERRSCISPGVAQAVVFKDPKDLRVARQEQHSSGLGARPPHHRPQHRDLSPQRG